MRSSLSKIIVPGFFLFLALVNAGAQDNWKQADIDTVRLTPSAFSILPEEIVNDLEKRGCTIPQTYMNDEPHNVISGEFGQKGQIDWAVLCSINRESEILIYWKGKTAKVSAINKTQDEQWLQGIGGEKIGFSRAIDAVDAAYIYDHHKRYGGLRPPKITHHGINEAFTEKASTVLYFHKGKWLELAGAD